MPAARRGTVPPCRDPQPSSPSAAVPADKPSAVPAADQPPSYEAALAELERLVEQMESGQLPLEQLLAAYQRGAELLNFCRDRLQVVEEQVRVLEEGQLKPWKSE